MRLTFGLALVLAALAAAPAAVAAGPWSPPADLFTQLRGFDHSDIDDGLPTLATNARGDALAVWIRKRPAGDCCSSSRVVASFRPAGGRFGAVRPVSPIGDEPSGHVATIDEAGNATVAWTVNELYADLEFTRARIDYADRPAGAEAFGPARTLRAGGSGAFRPRLASVAGGETVIVWEEAVRGTADLLSPLRIRAAARRGLGDFGEPEIISTRNPRTRKGTSYRYGYEWLLSEVEVSPGGQVAVPWLRYGQDGDTLMLSTRGPGGRFAPPVEVARENATGTIFVPGVAADRERGWLVHWLRDPHDEKFDADDHDLLAEARYMGAGGGQAAQEAIPFVDAEHTSYPNLAFHPDGTATATWTGGGLLHRSTRVPGGGFGPVETAGQPATDPRPYSTTPELAELPDGALIAVWSRTTGQRCERYGCNPSGWVVEAARLPSTGGIEPHGQVSALHADEPVVRPLDGGALALWSGYHGPQMAGLGTDPAAPPAPGTSVPTISRLSLAGCTGPARSRRCVRPRRPVFTFTLSEPGPVAVRLCECPKEFEGRSLRVLRGTGRRGTNRLPVPRSMLAALRRGRYEATLFAENAAGNDARGAWLSFTLAGRP